jgi:hypothetical protein
LHAKRYIMHVKTLICILELYIVLKYFCLDPNTPSRPLLVCCIGSYHDVLEYYLNSTLSLI